MKPDIHHPTSEDLFAYRDGELPPERRTLVEAHVLACGHCRDQIDEMSALESDLRLRPDGVGAEYFEAVQESVLARVASAKFETEAIAPVAPIERRPSDSIAAVDRRRPDAPPEEVATRRRLRMPWIGIAGTGSAAVAVLLVVVLLMNRRDEWVRAPRPGVVRSDDARKADRDAAASKERARRDGAAESKSKLEAERRASDEKTTLARGKDAVTPEKGATLESRAARELPPAADQAPALNKIKNDPASPQAGDVNLGAGSANQERSAETGMKKLSVAPSAGIGFGRAPGEAYAGVLREHGLPVLWDEGVPTDALLGAESDLRLVYQTRKAGADSARIRLYIAEAERARIGDPPNHARVEAAAHHYRRAIALARGDAELQALARRRLAELLMTTPPASAEPESDESN